MSYHPYCRNIPYRVIFHVFEVLIVFCSIACIVLCNMRKKKEGAMVVTLAPSLAPPGPDPTRRSNNLRLFLPPLPPSHFIPPLHLLVRAVCIGLFYWVYSQPSQSTATLVCPPGSSRIVCRLTYAAFAFHCLLTTNTIPPRSPTKQPSSSSASHLLYPSNRITQLFDFSTGCAQAHSPDRWPSDCQHNVDSISKTGG